MTLSRVQNCENISNWYKVARKTENTWDSYNKISWMFQDIVLFFNRTSMQHCVWVTDFCIALFQLYWDIYNFHMLRVSNGNVSVESEPQLSTTVPACPALQLLCSWDPEARATSTHVLEHSRNTKLIRSTCIS